MLLRIALFVACALVFLLATARRAHAEPARPSPLDRFFASLRPPQSAMRDRPVELIGREVSTSLGVPSCSPSAIGASLAGLGIATWAIAHRGRPSAVTIGPRLYHSGGGMGFTVRF